MYVPHRSRLRRDTSVEHMDRILYHETAHATELNKDLRLGASLDADCQLEVRRLLIKYWDCFAKEGARWTILGYEFGIDTSGAKPVYCKNPMDHMSQR